MSGPRNMDERTPATAMALAMGWPVSRPGVDMLRHAPLPPGQMLEIAARLDAGGGCLAEAERLAERMGRERLTPPGGADQHAEETE